MSKKLTAALPSRDKLFVGCPKDAEDNYAKATGIDVSSVAYSPDERMNGLVLASAASADGAGNIALTLENGGEMTLPFTVPEGESVVVLRGVRIKKIDVTGTTFTGKIFPLF